MLILLNNIVSVNGVNMLEGQVLNTEIMNIFFDESGRQKDKPTTMGGLIIPQVVYSANEFSDLTEKLKNGDIKLHWTDYSGHGKTRQNIIEAITTFSKYAKYTKMNVINYNQHSLRVRKNLSEGHDFSELMLYTKIPERIFYGLLRNYGQDVYIKANVYIEEATVYKRLDLPTRIMEQLNSQSLYRGEQFSIVRCEMHTKNQMIGIEIVDLILGIIRSIIQNVTVPAGLSDEEIKEMKLKKKKAKNDLVVQLLKINDFNEFLSSIKYFEWNSNKELSEVNFEDYLRIFMAAHFREF
ncbi:DUF3800 domain-containing protein [Desertibacillus haloalkaliphilus]|uniref:DUF3800 domain-containing protein n=1 Tax=Desertibacillus haloalkaliphilus TaxID=1328930 RepID=UPI001C26A79C|nr:DUF3800 domain-containing protein [Desertibacillus haloalkaliphilus]MBU8908101.1 DUF3800 domain-containing protein [Desertibacillus haloalkaliphilus]